MGPEMTRFWKGMLACFFLGTAATKCTAKPQDQLSAGPDQGLDARGSSHRDTANPDDSVDPVTRKDVEENRLGLRLLKNIAEDQKAVFIAPKHLRLADADWLVPLGGATAAMLATDTDFSRHLTYSPSRLKYSKDMSNYGIASLVGIGGGFYLWGQITHDDHKSETGILAGEAAIDSFAATYALKYAFGRERPDQN